MCDDDMLCGPHQVVISLNLLHIQSVVPSLETSSGLPVCALSRACLVLYLAQMSGGLMYTRKIKAGYAVKPQIFLGSDSVPSIVSRIRKSSIKPLFGLILNKIPYNGLQVLKNELCKRAYLSPCINTTEDIHKLDWIRVPYICTFAPHDTPAYNHSWVEHIVKVFFRLTRLHIVFHQRCGGKLHFPFYSFFSHSLFFPPSSLTQLHVPCLSKKQAGCRLSLLSAPSVMQYGPLAW